MPLPPTARFSPPTHPPTHKQNDNTSGNYWTYNYAIAEHFLADIIPVAWSGKGM